MLPARSNSSARAGTIEIAVAVVGSTWAGLFHHGATSALLTAPDCPKFRRSCENVSANLWHDAPVHERVRGRVSSGARSGRGT